MHLLLTLIFMLCANYSECTAKDEIPEKKEQTASTVTEELIETTHSITINGQKIDYLATAGNLILRNDARDASASLFFVSYTKIDKNATTPRPVTFCFNGGPGSSSVWLHIGALGPKRVVIHPTGITRVPTALIDNSESMLDQTDLVFIDPVSTGFSFAIPRENASHFYGVDKDIESIAQFIQLYLTRFNRWEAPKYLIGESYGTTRAVGLAGLLHDKYFIDINGLVLISSILNFQSISSNDDLSYLCSLPSFTATAWYHKKLKPDLLANFEQTIEKAKEFVQQEYCPALFKGNLLPLAQRDQLAIKLADFTGLPVKFIKQNNLRVTPGKFAKELLRSEQQIMGKFDSRLVGYGTKPANMTAEYEPSWDAVFGAFTAAFNNYLSNDLNVKKQEPYHTLNFTVKPWNYESDNCFLNLSQTLQEAMTQNPHLNVFVASGYYDLILPFYATDYTFHHLNLNPNLNGHLTMKYYQAGHMMYTDEVILKKLKGDLKEFYHLYHNP